MKSKKIETVEQLQVALQAALDEAAAEGVRVYFTEHPEALRELQGKRKYPRGFLDKIIHKHRGA